VRGVCGVTKFDVQPQIAKRQKQLTRTAKKRCGSSAPRKSAGLKDLPLFHATIVLRERRQHHVLVVDDAVMLSHRESGLGALTAEACVETVHSFDVRALLTSQNDASPISAD
jgi:hypothetical protein